MEAELTVAPSVRARNGTMRTTSIPDLCAHLDEHVEEIVTEWLAVATEEPWSGLTRDERLNHLPDLVRGILDASLCTPAEPRAHREKVAAAIQHGMQRRRQGFDGTLLFAAYTFIREAMRRHLLECDLPRPAATEALLRIDIATTVASLASLRGFYRSEHEKHGRWEELVEEMARESLLLQAGR